MKYSNILGLTLQQGLKILENNNLEVEILYTKGLNKRFAECLSESRIIRLDYNDKKVEVVVSYF